MGRSRRGPLWIAVCLSVPLVASFPLTGDTLLAGIVGETPFPGVLTARDVGQACKILEAELPGAEGRLLIISPQDHLSSLILPLIERGKLTEFQALLPHDNVLGEEQRMQVVSYFEKAGIPREELSLPALQDGVISGTVCGVPFRLASLASLPDNVGANFLVVMDAAFPIALYRNEVATPLLDIAWSLVSTLRNKRVHASNVVVLDTVGSDEFPLEHGYLAALLKEMVIQPGDFEQQIPAKWQTLRAADSAFFFMQYAEGMALYRAYLGDNPSDASACYKIAQMAARDLDVELVLHWLNRAAAIDRFYNRAYSDVAGYFFGKEMFRASERILLSGLSKFPNDPLLATNLAGVYISLGDARREVGDTKGAMVFYRKAIGVEGADPAMRDRARTMLQAATDMPSK